MLPRISRFACDFSAWFACDFSESPRRLSASDAEYSTLPGRQANRLHVEDPFLPRNLNCVLSPENEEKLGKG